MALAELAGCDPAELSRVARLREVHARCAAAGVLDAAAGSGSASAAAHAASAAGSGASDVARLHALFDAAVRHGMPQLVCHYVEEVCSHDDFSSPDGVEVSQSASIKLSQPHPPLSIFARQARARVSEPENDAAIDRAWYPILSDSPPCLPLLRLRMMKKK